MKYGAHIFLWIDRWGSQHLPLIAQARALGLDCLEIAVGNDVAFDAKAIRQQLETTGMELFSSPGGVWPMEMDISLSDSRQVQKALDWHKQWIAISAEAGAIAYTGALYGHPGNVLRQAPDPDEHKRICENLNQLADYAAGMGVKIVLEPMSHFRTHIANTAEQLASLIQGADHNNLYALMDTYHMVTELRDYGAAVDTLGEQLFCLHACENDRGVPGGGIIPWHSIAEGLVRNNFDAYVLFESYNSTLRNGDFAYERGMFHNVCPDGDQFVKSGLAFLKPLFERNFASKI